MALYTLSLYHLFRIYKSINIKSYINFVRIILYIVFFIFTVTLALFIKAIFIRKYNNIDRKTNK